MMALEQERDLQKLYFLYLTSSPEDWLYVMDSNGLASHLSAFQATESQSGKPLGVRRAHLCCNLEVHLIGTRWLGMRGGGWPGRWNP